MATQKVEWTKDQVRLVLNAVLLRLQRNSSSFELTCGADELKIESRKLESWTSITVKKNYIFLYISDMGGHVDISPLFWRDKELKKVIKIFLSMKEKSPQDEAVTAALHKIFPEMTDIEFEDKVLK
jgi:hypothetical protein